MAWSEAVVGALAEHRSWAYHGTAPHAVEPAALTALALLAHDRVDAARAPLDWLVARQAADGSVGVTESQDAPHWPTAQAILAWQHARRVAATSETDQCQAAVRQGVRWLLQAAGTALAPTAELGHDPRLIGWPWVEGTHSWLEPTSWSVLALRAAGYDDHPRTREGIRLLVDRLLPGGGANYGNTYVLGQLLRPHVQPTGVCLLALAGEPLDDRRIAASVEYLRRELNDQTTTISLCCGLFGLAAQRRLPHQADSFLAAAARRTLERDAGAYKLALLALAALGEHCPLIESQTGRSGR